MPRAELVHIEEPPGPGRPRKHELALPNRRKPGRPRKHPVGMRLRDGRLGAVGTGGRGRPRKQPLPAHCPLDCGWRKLLVQMIEQHGLVDVQDVLAAYAEFRVRQDCLYEPHDPLAIGSEALALLTAHYPAARRICDAADYA
jgi:hypothetical protein